MLQCCRRDGEEEAGSPGPDTLTLPGGLSRFFSAFFSFCHHLRHHSLHHHDYHLRYCHHRLQHQVWSASRAVRKALVVGAYDEFLRKGKSSYYLLYSLYIH